MQQASLEDIGNVKSAFDVDRQELQAFYKKLYPHRFLLLTKSWKWLYRPDKFDNNIPLVVEKEGKVIAHAGMIPFKIRLNNQVYTAMWYVDFAVLPEFQRKGLGVRLTKHWMDFADLHVTFCNEKSLA